MRYRKKPVVVEAFKFDKLPFFDLPDWFAEAWVEDIIYTTEETSDTGVFIATLEGHMFCSNGDYVIQGVNGEIYPCKPDIFHQTYDILEEVAE